MTDSALSPLLFEVAGIRFRLVAGPRPLPPPPPYDDFLGARTPDDLASDLRIRVECAGSLTLPADRLFSAGGSWSLAREGADRIVILDPPALGGGAWCTIRFPAAVDEALVTLGVPGPYHLSYPLDQILLMYRLCRAGGAILHGAGFGRSGGGFAFPGVSGAGKTTLAGLLRNRGWEPLSDDRVIVRELSGEPFLFGTPWPGEGMIAVNRSLPLRGIFFLKQGAVNGVRDLPVGEGARRLLAVASIPWYDPDFLPEALAIVSRVAEQVPFRELTFRPEPEAAAFLEGYLERG
jgi:hypothetical protein